VISKQLPDRAHGIRGLPLAEEPDVLDLYKGRDAKRLERAHPRWRMQPLLDEGRARRPESTNRPHEQFARHRLADPRRASRRAPPYAQTLPCLPIRSQGCRLRKMIHHISRPMAAERPQALAATVAPLMFVAVAFAHSLNSPSRWRRGRDPPPHSRSRPAPSTPFRPQ